MVPPGEVIRGIRGGRPRLRGESTLKPPAAIPPKSKKRVLFICIGNSCRSQMAEAFARSYGSDVLLAESAGVAPAGIVAPLTRQVLAEKNISSEGQIPKGLAAFAKQQFEVVVNISGQPLPLRMATNRSIEWSVRDPIGQSQETYRAVAVEIENLVMRLILELRGK